LLPDRSRRMSMNPDRSPKASTSRDTPSWRQRIEDALSSLKVAPPDCGLHEQQRDSSGPSSSRG
jgi:hypothetical protein